MPFTKTANCATPAASAPAIRSKRRAIFGKRLDALRTERRPIEVPADERRKDVIWVKPKMVVEAEFAGITHGGVLRQASFKGIREDKAAEDVVREVAAGKTPARLRRRKRGRRDRRGASEQQTPARGSAATPSPCSPHASRSRLLAGCRRHQKGSGRILRCRSGIGSEPHILDRALSLVRAPEGITGETFFQKHIAANIKSSPLRRVVPGKDHDVIAVETVADLIALVQSGALEIHVRGSRLDSLETCDRIVFDLDPGEGVRGRRSSPRRARCASGSRREKLESFVKLTGGKGIHVVLPIADADWDTAKNFSATNRLRAWRPTVRSFIWPR